MSGYFPVDRGIEDTELWQKPPLYLKVWLWLRARANYQTGDLPPITLSYVAEEVEWKEHKPSRKHILHILKWLASENFIKIHSGNKRVTMITIVDIGDYANSTSKQGNKQVTSRLQASTILDEEVKEVHLNQNPSPDGDGRAAKPPPAIPEPPAEPEPEKKPLRRTRTPKPDSGDALMVWIDETYPGVQTRTAWGRFAKSLNELLADRRRENPDGAFVEAKERFGQLMAGDFDHAYPWNDGRKKNIPGFVQFYYNLTAMGNGKGRVVCKTVGCNFPVKHVEDDMWRCDKCRRTWREST